MENNDYVARANDPTTVLQPPHQRAAQSAGNVITTSADGAQSVFTADLNGDGATDVLSASIIDNKIAWYRNLGNGTFSNQQEIITINALAAAYVFAADLNGDGAVDVLSASNRDKKIAWYRNMGNGTFSAENIISISANGAWSVFAADLNGDGKLDVLSASELDNKIAWYRNQGDETFTEQPAISITATGARSVFAADLNGDGKLDVLSASHDDNKIAWYRNNGDETFTEQPAITTSARGAWSVFAADLNGDGKLDVLSASDGDNKIAWYRNQGDETFTEQPAISTAALGARSAVAADLNGDGKLDVVSASANDNKVAWYRNLGSGAFSDEQIVTTSDGLATAAVAADLNGDGALDVVSAFFFFDKIAWYPIRDLDIGAFSAESVVTTAAAQAWSVFAADLNGDGKLDMLSASGDDRKIAWYRNEGDGTFLAQPAISTSAQDARSVFAADLDGDGALDVLSASVADNKVAWYQNLGNETFSEQKIITTDAGWATSVFAADLDGDGALDVVSASFQDNTIAWYRNLRDGTFSTKIPITVLAVGAQSVFVADLNGDGAMDVLSASISDNKIAWYRNLGNGNFSEQHGITTSANGAASVFAADLDGDGALDVLSASVSDWKIAWYRNLGNENFSEQRIIANLLNIACWSVFAADLDGDGALDVLSASQQPSHYDGTIAWYRNLGGGTFSAQQIISSNAIGARSVFAADLDGDGALDVLSASFDDNKIAWYQNVMFPHSSSLKVKVLPSTATSSVCLPSSPAFQVCGFFNFTPQVPFWGAQGGFEVIDFQIKTLKLTSPLILDRAYSVRSLLLAFPSSGLTIDCSSVPATAEACVVIRNSVVGSGTELRTHGGPVSILNFGRLRGLLLDSCSDDTGKLFYTPHLCALLPTASPVVNFPCSGLMAPYKGGSIFQVSNISSGGVWVSDGSDGGMLIRASSVTLKGCRLNNCTARVGGGGGLSIVQSVVSLDQCTFGNNSAATDGGGLLVQSSTVTLSSCIISLNVAKTGSGGGLAVISGSVLAFNSSWWNNSAASNGGGVSCASLLSGYTVSQSFFASSQSSFSDNSAAGNGGGLFLGSCLPNSAQSFSWTLLNSSVTMNNAAQNGGGIFHTGDSSLVLLRSQVTGNKALMNGGGVYSAVATASNWVLPFYLSGSSSNMTANTAAGGGGGLYWLVPQNVPLSVVTPLDPQQVNNAAVFLNTALYGGDFATNAVSVEIQNNTISLANQTSGAIVTGQLVLTIKDFHGTTVNTDSSTRLLLVSDGTLQGSIQPLFSKGFINFTSRFSVIASPGTKVNISFLVTQNTSILSVPFPFALALRSCVPGESETFGKTCSPCTFATFSNVSGATSCTSCPAGTFANTTGNSECSPCPVGRASSVDGSQSCVACPAGTHASETKAVVCAPCPVQSFQNVTGAAQCITCAAGQIAAAVGSSACTDCLPGTYANGSSCTACPSGSWGSRSRETSPSCQGLCAAGYWCASGSTSAFQFECGSDSVYCPAGSNKPQLITAGFFAADGGSSSTRTGIRICPAAYFCQNGVKSPCSPGRFANASGLSECLPCPSGTFSNSSAANNCTACQQGSSSSLQGVSSCNLCSPGRFSAESGRTECAPCLAGTSVDFSGATACLPCPSGSFTFDASSVACQPCPRGRFANVSGISSCFRCPSGTFSTLNSSQCQSCEPGFFTANYETSECLPCDSGKFATTAGKTICDTCATNTFSPVAGLANCTACREGSFTNTEVGFQVCQACPSDQYLISVGEFVTCRPCLLNAVCQRGKLLPNPGYWLAMGNNTDASVFKCPQGTCVAKDDCGFGRVNPPADNVLCGRCLDGFSEFSGEYVDCRNGVSIGAVIGILVAACVWVTVLHVSYRLSWTNKTMTTTVRSNRFGIMLNFLQAATLAASANPSSSLLFFLNLVNLDIFSTASGGQQCLFQASQEISLVIPFISQLLLMTLLVVPFVIYRLLQYEPSCQADHRGQQYPLVRVICGHNSDWNFRGFARSLLAVFWYGFYSVVGACLLFFRCVRVPTAGGTVRVIQSHPATDCDSTSYHQLVVLFVFVVLIQISVPVVLHFYAYRLEWSQAVVSPASIFFQYYRPDMFLWELVMLFCKKIPLLCVVVYSPAPVRASLIAAVVIVNLLLHLHYRPYHEPVDNFLEQTSLIGLIAIVLILASINNDTNPTTSEGQAMLAWLLIFGLFLLAFVVVWLLAVKLEWTPAKILEARVQGFFQQNQLTERYPRTASTQPSQDVAPGLRTMATLPAGVVLDTASTQPSVANEGLFLNSTSVARQASGVQLRAKQGAYDAILAQEEKATCTVGSVELAISNRTVSSELEGVSADSLASNSAPNPSDV